ncbi:MAG: S8 family serine peptidase [Raineya sp.]|nr:S8 family serine peptidase [Raineya sp.]MDW8296363.1 S8 family serine peptidase [Raineya sp.]
MFKKTFTIYLLGVSVACFAQNAKQVQWIREHSNTAKLQELAQKFRNQEVQAKKEAYELARKQGLPIFKTLSDGRIAELQYFEHGVPIYFVTTSNLNAAATTKASDLWTGGVLGLNVNGQGMIVGEWDGGAVRATHQELNTRVIQQDGAAFAVNSNTSHATHVAGTLIASGVQSNAKGMAHQATLWANDWTSDLSEATSQANNGLLISNHSYGYNVTSLQQWQFGYYDSNSANWDELCFNAPFYLPCFAAGNDRNNNPNPSAGGYDLITGRGLAKNVLTVGAVNIQTNYTGPSSVVMSSFSNWGPTDDGRIKPDVVGAGVGIYSSVADNDNAYATYNGTSMATPNVAGTLILLQQHYRNLNAGQFMRSATLKALVIHTANEAGNAPGPDYSFGWGLVNANKAAQVISNRGTTAFIEERTLNNGTSQTFQITAQSSSIPLEITIAWTDPKGTPAPANIINPPNLMLVNDLDVRVWRNNTDYHFPWVLDPANPSAPATRGDNFRDNVEKIIIDNPVAGATYYIQVCHKGTLQGGSQAYSMIITGGTGFAIATATPPPLVFAKFTQSKTEGKNGEIVSFTDASSVFSCGSPAITTWNWNFDVNGVGGASPATFSGKNPPMVTFAKSENYLVRLTVSNGTNTDVFTSNVNIGLANPTNLQITNLLNNGTHNYVINQTDLAWQDNSDETNFEVQRRLNEVGNPFTTIATLPANTTTYSDNTIEDSKNYVYRVRAIKGSLTPAPSNVVSILTVSFITNLSEELNRNVQLYPNPATTEIQLELGSGDKIQHVTIFNQLGQKVMQVAYTNEPIQVSHLPKGIYLVEIQTQQQRKVTKKLVLH